MRIVKFAEQNQKKRTSWNQRYQDGRADWSTQPSRVVVETESEITGAAAASGQTPRRALDLACGTGRNALFLARRGWTVTGVDFSDSALETARERTLMEKLSVQWLQQDLEEWIPPTGAFDLVLICYLHLPWPLFRTILNNAERALAPGGTLLVLGHDRSNITEGTGKPKYPEVAYTPEEVSAALEGATMISAELDWYPSDRDPEIHQIDCIVKARL